MQTCPHILSQVSLKSQFLSHFLESCNMFTNCSFPANYGRGRWTPHTPLGREVGDSEKCSPVVFPYNVCQIRDEIAVEKDAFLCHHHGVCQDVLQVDLQSSSSCIMLKCSQQEGHLRCSNGHYLSDSATDIPAGCKANQPTSAI